jgi:hypothetical protein
VQELPSSQPVPFALAGFEQPLSGSHVPASWHESLAMHTTGVPVQPPLWQVSDWVHAFPSLQALPIALTGFEQFPVDGSHVPASWQESLAGHGTGFNPVQTPLWQLSNCVQAFPSLHAVPFGLAGLEHPATGSQVPASWQASLAVHSMMSDPTHTPLRHASVRVQTFPSLHAAPSGFAGFEQPPVAGSQIPATWQASLGVHVTGFDPVHTPLWQVSVRVHAFPSSQAAPFPFGGLEQRPVAGAHIPATWQASLGVHVTGLDPVHTPPWQVSVWVHPFPSLQAAPFPFGGFEQRPVAGAHVPASWQASLAVHTTGFDPLHTPLWQVSVRVHAFPSLHGVPSGAPEQVVVGIPHVSMM